MASNDFDPLFDAAGKKYNVDPKLLKTVFMLESGGNAGTQDSYQGAQGGMQMLPSTAKAMGASNPRDMTQAIPAAARYLAEGLDATGSPQGALAYYHGGPNREIWGPKTAAYVAKGASTYPTIQLAGSQDMGKSAPDPFSATLSAPAPKPDAPDAFSASMGGGGQADAPDAFSATLAAPAPAAAAQAGAPQTSVGGLGNSFLRGVHQATDAPAAALARGADWVAGKLGYDTNFAADATKPAQDFNAAYDANPDNKSFPNRAAKFVGDAAVTIPAAIGAGKAVEGVLGGALTAAPRVAAVASPVVSGAAQGATVSAMNGEDVKSGAAAGGIAGGALGALGWVGNKLLKTATPEIEAAINKYGIPLRAGQTSNSKFVRYVDSQIGNLPGTGQAASNAAQQTAFNRAVAGTFGESAEKITPAVMQSAKDRIGAGLNAIESAHNVSLAPVLPDIQQIAAKAQGGLTSEEFGVVKRVLNGVLQNIGPNGEISGTTFGNLVGHNSPLNVAVNSQNGNVRSIATEIKGALQDALQQSLPQDVAKDYAALRLQYKNLMTVAPLVNRGTPGDISPALLQSVANRSFKQNAFRGAGDLGELGDIGQTFLKSPPDSGTATRSLVNNTMYGDAKSIARLVGGATVGRAAGSLMRANPLTGPSGVPGTLPSVLLLRNRLLEPGTGEVTR